MCLDISGRFAAGGATPRRTVPIQRGSSYIRLDASNGFAQPALEAAAFGRDRPGASPSFLNKYLIDNICVKPLLCSDFGIGRSGLLIRLLDYFKRQGEMFVSSAICLLQIFFDDAFHEICVLLARPLKVAGWIWLRAETHRRLRAQLGGQGGKLVIARHSGNLLVKRNIYSPGCGRIICRQKLIENERQLSRLLVRTPFSRCPGFQRCHETTKINKFLQARNLCFKQLLRRPAHNLSDIDIRNESAAAAPPLRTQQPPFSDDFKGAAHCDAADALPIREFPFRR